MERPLHPFEGQSVAGLLDARARLSGDKVFLTWAPFEEAAKTWTYAQFADDVARVAGGLAARGVKRGERIVVLSENCPELLLAYFACAWMGAVCVPVNAASTPQELAYFLERTRAVGLITQGTTTDTTAWVVRVADFESLRGAPLDRVTVQSMDPVSILFTSGTTARPKGVVWTHANVLWGAHMGAMQEGLRADDVHLVFLPLFHVVALTWSILPTIRVGGSAVLQPRFSASRFWDAALAHRCTWASMVPFCTAVLAKQPVPASHHFRMWGHAVYSSDYEKLFGVKLLGWWGMTEIVTMGIVGDANLPQTPRTIGRPSVGYDIRVSGNGELLIRGERGVSIFREYLDDAEATRAAFDEDGYFRTGDRVRVMEDGTIQFIDRIKDVIKVGGENVAAPEVERVIGAVAGVREVAVVAKPDPVLGEVPVAFVLAEAGAADLVERIMAACEAELAKFKRPREVRIAEDLPRVAIGKVSKAELRKRLS